MAAFSLGCIKSDQMPFEYFIIALLVGVIVLSLFVSFYDFKYRRIPNKLILTGLLYGVLVFVSMGFFIPLNIVFKGFLFGLIGLMAGGMFLYVPYKYKQVGAGDVKLVMVFGLLLGFKGVILSILVGAIIGGIWALGLAWRNGGLHHMWYNMKYMAKSMYLSGFKEMSWDLRSEGAVTMPYGVALSAGAVLIALQQMQIQYEKLIQLSLS
ncbi:MAG TPA: A24 family peptidase [Methylophilus sp.]|nr:A24 family peptidase [Methylophilus sp.]HQQ33863.1 A24 family peptidase [Methylophilus sp.]